MLNINFFEKKQVNVLPYVLAGVFLVLIVLMGIYFYFTQLYYNEAIEQDTAWVESNASDVALSRRIEQIDERTNQASSVQNTLTDTQFPMSYVTADLTNLIPEEENRVLSYQLSEADQIVLVLENTNVNEASSIINDFKDLNYIDRVQLLRLENQLNDSDQFLFELTLDLNREVLHEVTQK
ncbi:hypothetical protein [Alkalibacterium kapii]|uniref:Uncharacterized protein n=1 Tax=Alkalibacterium kapii TaxID=426704 RepID=A0A511AQZ2_9LACT|nr:hypothetical protein [Alkalibacterium kapii]GEK90609.1 hypothetical protein AKA01nite_02310 [Alkalibacterium kapii]